MPGVRTTNVYVIVGDRILLIQRTPLDENKPLWWEAPAGHVDVYCEPIDSMCVRQEALRELEEETGLVVSPYDIEPLPRFSSFRHMAYITRVSPKVMNDVRLSEEHCDYRWHRIFDPLPKHTRYEVRRFLRDTYNV